MNRSPMISKSLTLTTLAAAFASLPLVAGTYYEYIEIVPPSGTSLRTGQDYFHLSDSGRVFGSFQAGGLYRVYLWEKGTFTDLGPRPQFSGFSETDVREVESTGQFIADNYVAVGRKFFLWNNGPAVEILPPESTTISSVRSTDRGLIGGVLKDSDGMSYSFLWDRASISKSLLPVDLGYPRVRFITQSKQLFLEADVQSAGGAATQVYAFRDGQYTRVLPEEFYGTVSAVSESGVAAGLASRNSTPFDTIYTWANGTSAMGLVDASFEISAINDQGRIAGGTRTGLDDRDSYYYQPVTWYQGAQENAAPKVLVVNDSWSPSAFVDSTGQVFSFSSEDVFDSGNPPYAYSWKDGQIRNIIPQGGVTSFSISGITPDGRVFGNYNKRAFTWFNGVFTDLTPPGAATGSIRRLNSQGRVLGRSDIGDFTWFEGEFTRLPGQAHFINSQGQILLASQGRVWLAQPSVRPLPTSPVATIRGKKAVVTTKPLFTVKGQATGTVTVVSYRVRSGKWLKAKGTANWTANIRLSIGKNLITVVATGPGGTSRPVSVTAVRRRPSR